MAEDSGNDPRFAQSYELTDEAAPLSGPLTGVKICVIGAGFVGCITAAGFAKFGHEVVCVEKDPDKLAMLVDGRLPFFERDLENLIRGNMQSGRLSFSADLEGSLDGQKAVFIAVGTPSDGSGRADLGAVLEIIEMLSYGLGEGQVVVIRSTVPIGTAAKIKGIIRRNRDGSGDLPVISNPEFLREGTAVFDFFHPHRIVIGGDSPEGIEVVRHIYRMGAVNPAPVIVTNNETAEMIKYASNAFLAAKIGYINELAMLCDKVGINILEVARGMGLDSRIGPEFLNPGPGWGGSCLPKDIQEFLGLADSNGLPLIILEAVRRANEKQHDFVVAKVRKLTDGNDERRVGVLGLAFKAETSDVRNSPAIAVTRRLLSQGFVVKAYDPAAGEESRKLLPEIEIAATAYDALEGVDCALILTEWSEFQLLDWKKAGELMRHKAVVDARNVLAPESMRGKGFIYESMGQV